MNSNHVIEETKKAKIVVSQIPRGVKNYNLFFSCKFLFLYKPPGIISKLASILLKHNLFFFNNKNSSNRNKKKTINYEYYKQLRGSCLSVVRKFKNLIDLFEK